MIKLKNKDKFYKLSLVKFFYNNTEYCMQYDNTL